MSELQKGLNKIISDIEKNLKNEKDIEYVKKQIYNIYNIFIEEFEKLEEKANDRMESLLIRYKTIEDRMQDVEEAIDKIESDIYVEDEEDDYEFDITCPYCDTEFNVDLSNGLRDTVTCPECNNIIELEWNEHDHGGCSHDCCSCDECDDDCEDEVDDDDM